MISMFFPTYPEKSNEKYWGFQELLRSDGYKHTKNRQHITTLKTIHPETSGCMYLTTTFSESSFAWHKILLTGRRGSRHIQEASDDHFWVDKYHWHQKQTHLLSTRWRPKREQENFVGIWPPDLLPLSASREPAFTKGHWLEHANYKYQQHQQPYLTWR